MNSEIAAKANFSTIRYAQCWEDADILLNALVIKPTDTCLSICSAGDNTLSLLSQGPKKVIAIDLNPVQLHCLEARVAAYQVLTHSELLELMGARTSQRRLELIQRLESHLSKEAKTFFTSQQVDIGKYGLGGIGKFERYFRIFKNHVLPWIHSSATLTQLMQPKSQLEREQFFRNIWNNRRWRWLMRLFFSKTVMGKLGRDPAFFSYAEGDLATQVAERVKHALVQLDPSENPYLHWILYGQYGEALPHALREENFVKIRQHLSKLEWHCTSLEKLELSGEKIDKFNLSDIFEYMSSESFVALYNTILKQSARSARLAYWNMMVPRKLPAQFNADVNELSALAEMLHLQDKAFFYRRFVVEEVL